MDPGRVADGSGTDPGRWATAAGTNLEVEMPFRALGTVLEEGTERPLPGLRVRACDKDVFADDFLGEAVCDEQGRFEIVFTEVDFMDFHETRPDVYVCVFDPDGRQLLCTTEREIRPNTRSDETFEIRIPRDALGPG